MLVRTLYIKDMEHKDARTTDVDAKGLNISCVVQERGHCVQMTSKWRQANSVTCGRRESHLV